MRSTLISGFFFFTFFNLKFMHYWHRNQKGKNSLGLSKSISKLVQGQLLKVRRKWVQVAKKSTGIRDVSQFTAPDASCSHSLQHKLNRLYLKDEFAGELISRWGVKEGKSHSPRSDSALICEGQRRGPEISLLQPFIYEMEDLQKSLSLSRSFEPN